MISSRREDRTSGAASREAPARPLLRDQFRPHRRQTFHPGARRRRGRTGYGECVAEQDPYYSSETNDTAWHIISDFIAPRVLGVEFAHPREVFPALKAIRGHNMAKAAVEMAAWDLFAKQRGEPLSRVLGGSGDRIASGVSIGIQPSLDALAGEGRTRARRRLPAHQDQDQAGLGSRAGGDDPRALRRDPVDGRRQRRLHARPTPIISRGSIVST
jgi:L-alanine-DL-glutamate epimerase and related enzymes of enolase superfamily